MSSQQPTLQRPRAHHQSRQPARDPSADAPSLTRRAAVGAAVGAALWPRALDAGAAKPRGDTSDWSSPGLAAPVDPNAPLFFKTPSGVPVQVLAEGTGGREARAGERLLVDFVVRRSNGYFIYSTVEGVSFQPRDVPTGPVVLTLVRRRCTWVGAWHAVSCCAADAPGGLASYTVACRATAA